MLYTTQDGHRQDNSATKPGGPPYPPRVATLGGTPGVRDVPVIAVFLFLYVVCGYYHFWLFFKNNGRGHRFMWSLALGGFCILRMVTMCLRIAWGFYPNHTKVGVAAQLFVYVGTMILFVINWFLTERIIRAQHPHWGWSRAFFVVHRSALACLLSSLIMILFASIQSVFTQDPDKLADDRILQLIGLTYFTFFCCATVALIIVSLVIPRKSVLKFGAGRLRTNIAILLLAAVTLLIGSAFRCAIAWPPPIPARDARGRPSRTPWYLSKACFYAFNFTTEILVVIWYAITRIDVRFHVADGTRVAPSTKGTYTRKPARTRPSRRCITDGAGTTETKGASAQTARDLETDVEKEASLSSSIDGTALVLDQETNTLVNPYRYPSSVLEVDLDTGHWKIKPAKRPMSSFHKRISWSSAQPKSWSGMEDNSEVPPAPQARSPTPNWPLCKTELPKGSVPVLEHVNRTSSSTGSSSYDGNLAFNAGVQSAGPTDDVSAISYTIDKTGERAGKGGGIQRHRSDTGRIRAHDHGLEGTLDVPSPPSNEESRVDDRPGTLSREQMYRLQVEEVRQRLSVSPSASASGELDQESEAGPDFAGLSQEWATGQTEDADLDKGRESPHTPSSVYSRDVGYRTSQEDGKDFMDTTHDRGNDGDVSNQNDRANGSDNSIGQNIVPNYDNSTYYAKGGDTTAYNTHPSTNDNGNDDNDDDNNNDMPEDDNLSYGTAEEDFRGHSRMSQYTKEEIEGVGDGEEAGTEGQG